MPQSLKEYFTTGITPEDWDRFSVHWNWLLPQPFRFLGMTAFGDCFLQEAAETIYFLDLVGGELTAAAASEKEWRSLLHEPETIEEWLMPGLIEALQARGVPRPAGHCYAFQIHPLFGGEIAPDNIIVLPAGAWHGICGQLHRQARGLPPLEESR